MIVTERQWAKYKTEPAVSWQEQIEVDAASAQSEIAAMAECARRSIGQRFRYLRERAYDELAVERALVGMWKK